jgi:hypothetical protein
LGKLKRGEVRVARCPRYCLRLRKKLRLCSEEVGCWMKESEKRESRSQKEINLIFWQAKGREELDWEEEGVVVSARGEMWI